MTENERMSISGLLDVLNTGISFSTCHIEYAIQGNVLEDLISCLEELEQYKAIGTVEGYKRAVKVSKESYYLCAEYKAKLKEYEAIGTIDEFKALKEKNNKDFELLLKAIKESYPMFKGAYVELDVFMGDVMRRFTRERK